MRRAAAGAGDPGRCSVRSAHFKEQVTQATLKLEAFCARETVLIGDIIIGTYCIEHRHTLLHGARGFAPMLKHLGLKVLRRQKGRDVAAAPFAIPIGRT